MAKSQTPATAPDAVLAVRRSTDVAQLDELDRILMGGDFETEIIDDPNIISRQIVAELLAAENDDDLEFVGQAQGWQELEGIPIEIQGFRWRPSDFTPDDPTRPGNAIYLVVFGNRMDDGEAVVLTTGSLNVCAQLSNLARRGSIPGAVRMLARAEKPTRNNFYPLRLVSTPEEVERRKQARQTERETAKS